MTSEKVDNNQRTIQPKTTTNTSGKQSKQSGKIWLVGFSGFLLVDFFPRQHHLRGLLSVNKAIGIGITFLANGSDKFTKKRSYDPPFTAFKKRSKTKTGAFDNTLKKPQLFDFHTENAEEKPILVYRLVLLLDVFRHFFHIVSFSSKAPGRFNSENSLLIATLRRLVFRGGGSKKN